MNIPASSVFLVFVLSLWPDEVTSQAVGPIPDHLLQHMLRLLRPEGQQVQSPTLTIDEEIMNAAGEEEFNSDISDASNGEYKIQGDMVIKLEDLPNFLEPEPAVNGGLLRKKRKTPSDASKIWPGGEVLIAFDSNSRFTTAQRMLFQDAINQWQQKTCIRFRTPTINDVHQGRTFIFVQDGKGCSSPLGMNPMRQTGIFRYQPLTLSQQCRTRRIMMHEIGHSLGLIHEQSRNDRDGYVTVLWRNVPIHMRHNFQRFTDQVTHNRRTPYDYRSLMHYGPKAFSNNGQPTLRTTDSSFQDRIGAFQEISEYDALAINNMYNCRDSSVMLRANILKPRQRRRKIKSDLRKSQNLDREHNFIMFTYLIV